ncbi:TetR/AcrR family transcriptional regulator [Virgibacillus salinus]|uniref:Transcriptional regulator, TetR family n=1 Tax=Virgibacillus salinus TaxID=553311 RepID=A0A1H0YFS1_9BACI|nr:TetR/AcrR family transcriptional regulator [Virgibacillus salinus]SDQ13883.1 transcriptional regulator, TetR family [Virgibacillus salinus]
MNDKKMKLIEAGMKLFAEKGYHKTSIQEIASEAGVSKGAFYLYFQSKEDFITTAFHFYHDEITEQIKKVSEQNLEPRASLAKQIEVIIAYIYEYKDFITMQLRENISIGQDTDAFIRQMKMQNFYWLRQNISDIYGEKVTPYVVDVSIQLDGLMNGYFKWIVIDDIDIDRTKIGAYLVRRIDDIVRGLLDRDEIPLITEKNIANLYQDGEQQLTDLKEKVHKLQLPQEKVKQLDEVIDIILKEINKDEPQYMMVQGLLVHFQRISELEKECEEIARILHIDLLD